MLSISGKKKNTFASILKTLSGCVFSGKCVLVVNIVVHRWMSESGWWRRMLGLDDGKLMAMCGKVSSQSPDTSQHTSTPPAS